jgi:transcriptional regulator PpsR
MYSTVQVGDEKRVVAFGRDLRAISALQQRLVHAQQSMEADYARLQFGEMRYRVLFQLSSEAVLIVDSATMKIVEANPAADALFERGGGQLPGQALPDLVDPRSAEAVASLLTTVRVAGRADDVRAHLPDDRGEFVVSASLFRQDSTIYFLVRLSRVHADTIAAILPKSKTKLLKVVENAPDGFVVTAQDGAIITANAAFLEMAELATEEQALGESLERWFGRPGVDLDVLIANLRQRGSMRLFATTIRGEFGAMSEVEISAVSVMNGGHPCYGFAVRNVGRRLTADTRSGRDLPRSVGQITELIGRVALKDLVRESTDMIERLCIEAALELTGDNRASAAEMLGLSRQSLYVKLRRYGLGDLAGEPQE